MKATPLLLALLLTTLFTGVAQAAAGEHRMNGIVITKKNSVAATKGSDQYFTGNVSVQMLQTTKGDSRITAGLVTFQPGARTAWHTHPIGQLLLINTGKGRVQEWGGPVQEIEAGDQVWFPAGIKHWHGASDEPMSHYALQEELEGATVRWMEHVSNEQYNAE